MEVPINIKHLLGSSRLHLFCEERLNCFKTDTNNLPCTTPLLIDTEMASTHITTVVSYKMIFTEISYYSIAIVQLEFLLPVKKLARKNVQYTVTNSPLCTISRFENSEYVLRIGETPKVT